MPNAEVDATTLPQEIAIRLAAPSDLELLLSIDDDACALYGQAGIPLELPREHPFVRSDLERWGRSAERGWVLLAESGGHGVGFAALDVVDEQPYLDQLSVRAGFMRRGIGSRLLDSSAQWARSRGAGWLWLTTYAHVPFNRPFYERHGFSIVDETECGPGIRHHLAEQRRYLPAPAERIAMRRPL